jgi:hypothetical protein
VGHHQGARITEVDPHRLVQRVELPLARTLAAGIVNPALRARAAALEDPAGR